MLLSRYPRRFLAHLPTPLERLDRLSAELGGAELWIKRDDCTGLSTGGNKTRKLEFLMAEAELQKVDMVMTQGATQSNHARQTAAFAAKMGLECHIVLEDRTGSNNLNYNHNGNVLLEHLHGATTQKIKGENLNMNAELEAVADKVRATGKTVYTIPGGGSNATGALGYVNCAFEMLAQFNERHLKIDHIVHATGSAGTQAGLAVGLKAMNAQIPLLGIGTNAPKEKQEAKIFKLAQATAEKLNCAGLMAREDIVANTNYVGEGYGVPSQAGQEALRLFAELEGILLDPVYSAKGAAGLIDLVRTGFFKKDEKIVFIHTGGSAGLFGYDWAFDMESRWRAPAQS